MIDAGILRSVREHVAKRIGGNVGAAICRQVLTDNGTELSCTSVEIIVEIPSAHSPEIAGEIGVVVAPDGFLLELPAILALFDAQCDRLLARRAKPTQELLMRPPRAETLPYSGGQRAPFEGDTDA